MVGTTCLELTEPVPVPVPGRRELVPEHGRALELGHGLEPVHVREPAPVPGLEPVREHAVLELVPELEPAHVRGPRQLDCIQTWASPSCRQLVVAAGQSRAVKDAHPLRRTFPDLRRTRKQCRGTRP